VERVTLIVTSGHTSGRRDSNPRLRHGKAVRYQLRYDHVRASGRIRTVSLVLTEQALYLMSFEGVGPALRQGSYTRLVFGESQGLRSSALGISLTYGFPYRRLTLTGRPGLLRAARGIRTRNRPLLRRPRLPDCATAA
jgi:hypothetical protein